jgi:hypothetical protein
LNTRSLLQAIIGIWSRSGFDSSGITPGLPSVKRRSVITCNDRSHWTGSPSKTIAKEKTMIKILIRKEKKKSIYHQ